LITGSIIVVSYSSFILKIPSFQKLSQNGIAAWLSFSRTSILPAVLGSPGRANIQCLASKRMWIISWWSHYKARNVSHITCSSYCNLSDGMIKRFLLLELGRDPYKKFKRNRKLLTIFKHWSLATKYRWTPKRKSDHRNRFVRSLSALDSS
jgi:hypothetical protein